jgi:RNA polymerase-binding protein DksA
MVAERLAAQRSNTVAEIDALTRDLGEIIGASTGVATDDEHDPEGATIAFERAQVSAILDGARLRLSEIDRAMSRLADGTYGRCERCGEPIGSGRLAARPIARQCISCASA